MKPLVLLLSISLAMLTSCGNEPPRHPATSTSAPVAVQVSTAANRDWPAVYEATGTVRARTTGTVSSKVMGYVQQVSVQVGDRVREGQVLVTLNVRELEEGVRGAEANLDLAQTTFQRMENLAARKSISNQEFDEASAKLKAAQASYEMVGSKRAQIDPRLARAEQELRSAAIMRDYVKISTPFCGHRDRQIG